jgi:hypothetical protein
MIALFMEIYNSEAMLEEDTKIQTQRHLSDDPPDVEHAVAPILLWSDSTHLTNFGTASLWPIYLFFGSFSQYFHSKLSCFAAHHLAYIPLVHHIEIL